MINRQYLPLALTLFVLLRGATRLEAFTPSKLGPAIVSSSFGIATKHAFLYSSTCLHAEEEKGEEYQEPEPERGETKVGESAGTDILSSPAFLKRKVDVLKSDIEAADAEIEGLTQAVEAGKAEWGEQLEKLQNEYKNIQERLGNQNKKGDSMAVVQVVREMLDVLDNYDRAFGAVTPETDEEKAIEAAYKETYDQIVNTFENLGVSVIETVGKEFDYEYHQAVMQRPTDEYEEGVVCEEFQKGFVLGDTLIRASMVAVAV